MLLLNIYRYIKSFAWMFIFYTNFKLYNKYNLNILEIVIKNIQSSSALGIKFIQKTVPYLMLNNVDENIIKILKKSFEYNQFHSLDYTKKTFKEDYKYDITDTYNILDVISSGSIGQVYKIKSKETNELFALKIKHPNIVSELKLIKRIIKLFNLEKYCFFDLNGFLLNFEKETDFDIESNNTVRFYDLYKDIENIVIPKMLNNTSNILIMEYIDGESIDNLTEYEKSKYAMLVTLFINNNKLLNMNHGDLHCGNWKKHSLNKIVIYDFGFCFSIDDNKLTTMIDDLFNNLTSNIKCDFELRECLNYVIKFHIDKDINDYKEDIERIFIKTKIVGYSELISKSFNFFNENNIKVKMDYLNLVINYYHICNLNDFFYLDIYSYAKALNIFKEYTDYLKPRLIHKMRCIGDYSLDKYL